MVKRIVGLDFLRATLMLVGIPYHAGLIFTEFWVYTANNVHGKNIFAYLSNVPQSFRMQLFFVLAGFFSHLILARKGSTHFILSRVNRVFIPFFFFYMAQTLIAMKLPETKGVKWENALTGHFWFVYALMFYSAITLLFQNRLTLFSNITLWQFTALSIFCLSVKNFVVYEHFILRESFSYFPFYILGFAFYEKLEKFQISKVQTIILSALFVFLFLAKVVLVMKFKNIEYYSLFREILTYIIPFPAIWVLFYTFYNLKIKQNKIIDLIVKSAFIVYLLHHPLVAAYAYFFDQYFTLSPAVLYLSVIILTLFTCYTIYFLLGSQKQVAKKLAIQ